MVRDVILVSVSCERSCRGEEKRVRLAHLRLFMTISILTNSAAMPISINIMKKVHELGSSLIGTKGLFYKLQ